MGTLCEVDFGVFANDFTSPRQSLSLSTAQWHYVALSRLASWAPGRVTAVGMACEVSFGVGANDFTHPEESCCCRYHNGVLSLCFPERRRLELLVSCPSPISKAVVLTTNRDLAIVSRSFLL